MSRMTPEMLALCYGSLIAYLADFAFAFTRRVAWSPRMAPEGWE